MSVFYFDCLELRIDVCSLGDMIFAARDCKMITKEGLLLFVEARNIDCSLGDMVFAARDRKMITDECLLL